MTELTLEQRLRYCITERYAHFHLTRDEQIRVLAALSQPQPVAQWEAVAWLDNHGNVHDELIMAQHNCDPGSVPTPLYKATPAIPAGYRIVPVDDAKDIERFRWLTEDHADKETRSKRNELLGRMRVMSYSAATTDIDHAMLNAAPTGGV